MAKKGDLITIRAEFELLKNDLENEHELTEELKGKLSDKERILDSSMELLSKKKQEIKQAKVKTI